MARVFITGSSDGLGLLTGRMLVEQGHDVVLHARNAERGVSARASLPACKAVVLGGVSSMTETRSVADQVNALGRFDTIIHNVGVVRMAPGSSTCPCSYEIVTPRGRR